jgi:RES domain-containing protein
MTEAQPDRRVSDTRPALEVSAIAVSLPAWCTGPDAPALDVASLPTSDANRWSGPGEPTIYLAGDPGVALAELGRHWEEQEGNIALWSADLSLAAAADLRDPRLRATLGLPSDPTWLLDAERCRMVAARLRSDGRHDGLIVPSVAFMDAGTRWNAVVFVECHPADLADVVRVRARDVLVRRAPTGAGD